MHTHDGACQSTDTIRRVDLGEGVAVSVAVGVSVGLGVGVGVGVSVGVALGVAVGVGLGAYLREAEEVDGVAGLHHHVGALVMAPQRPYRRLAGP